MSITVEQPRVQKGNQKSFHQKRNSDHELDVFEATDYFSGANDIYGMHLSTPHLKMSARSSGRMNVDMNPVVSAKRNSFPAPTHHQKEGSKDEKKYKQPNSPGGKLASLLNSLFYQTSSNKKKSKITSSTQSMKDDHEIGSTRKRRSSISHFQSLNKTSSTSELNKPRPYAPTPTKNSFKYFQSHSADQKPDSTLSKISNDDIVRVKPSSASHKKVYISGINTAENSWMDEESFEFRTFNQISSKKYNTFVVGVLGTDKVNHSEDSANLKIYRNDEDDNVGDSDSSSDLFELQNYDLISCYSSDLPVYETTRIDDIKGGATNASRAI